MASIQQATIYADEALILRWGENNTAGRTVTLQLHREDGEHPFKGLPTGKNGQRVMIAVTLIGDDEKPAAPADVKRDKSPADKAIAKAHALASDPEFCRWAACQTDEEAMKHIRVCCRVSSTTEFRTNPEALKRFNDLCFEYEHRGMIR